MTKHEADMYHCLKDHGRTGEAELYSRMVVATDWLFRRCSKFRSEWYYLGSGGTLKALAFWKAMHADLGRRRGVMVSEALSHRERCMTK